ncbi:protein FLX-like 1 [Quillaja saponaria]|uniref:Protein FLX-like 1 n=1 Tax=Quillaja saponaria TaxID=32244 RepID=A0AAD7PLD6_QUISA|nr:protein FLX-like 1 [Quillaja saponaria]KAJ7959879.1 protein FLX-like 1 [Quillaja saponaria]
MAMAGRKHNPPVREVPLVRGVPVSRSRTLIDDPRHAHRVTHSSSSAAGRVIPVSVLEDRVAAQHREIQSLLLDNQRLAATHVALKQELAAAEKELRHLSAAAADIKAERDAEVREVYEKSLRMDAEVRVLDLMAADLVQVRADVQKLSAVREELMAQLQATENELSRVRLETQLVPAIKAEIEIMRQEIQRGRAAIEYEKKTCASNLEHGQAMDKNMIIMSREIEKLHGELVNAEKRARAAAAVAAAANPSLGYAAGYSNPEMGYGGIAYSDSYSMHQVQGSVDAQYASGAMPQHPYDVQHTHVHR